MELTCKHETICINEVVYDGVMEQSVELDHMLPDYCKNIFKILRCRLMPHITASGGVLCCLLGDAEAVRFLDNGLKGCAAVRSGDGRRPL